MKLALDATSNLIENPDGTFSYHRQEDVQSVIDQNKREYLDACLGNKGFSESKEMKRIARIPVSFIDSYKAQFGVDLMHKDNWPKLKAILNDPEFVGFRTAPGRA